MAMEWSQHCCISQSCVYTRRAPSNQTRSKWADTYQRKGVAKYGRRPTISHDPLDHSATLSLTQSPGMISLPPIHPPHNKVPRARHNPPNGPSFKSHILSENGIFGQATFGRVTWLMTQINELRHSKDSLDRMGSHSRLYSAFIKIMFAWNCIQNFALFNTIVRNLWLTVTLYQHYVLRYFVIWNCHIYTKTEPKLKVSRLEVAIVF